MEARCLKVALLAAVLCVSMGARHRSENFIVDTADPRLAPQIAAAAEKFRHDLAVEWLGKPMPNWAQPCVMSVQVGPHLGAGGATTFMFDRGEVYGWRMSIQGSVERIFDSVLPHEITHMIFASHFRRAVPRWADEGGATSVENLSERNKHFVMLQEFLRTGRGIAFNKLFAMKEYPSDVMPLYAEGYSLAEYLIRVGGRRKYVEFVGDGMTGNDWPAAVKKHYGIEDLGALQNTWLAWVRQGYPQLKPQPDHPAAAPATELAAAAAPARELVAAAATRVPRPQPNLVIRQSNDSPKAVLAGPLMPVVKASGPADPSRGFSSPDARLATNKVRPASLSLPTVQLPGSGWRAAGAAAEENVASVTVAAVAASPQPPSVDPFRAHVTRPQSSEPPEQIIVDAGGR